MELKVELIEHTPHPEEVVALAAETCHVTVLPDREAMSRDKREKIIGIVKESGHMSVLEHANFTFAIGDVSRSLTHQLVRHRLASYSQQSQRYVDMSDFTFVTPANVSKDPMASKVYKVIMENLAKGYEHLVRLGVPKEDARYILPNGATTNIVVTMNARELWHFFSLRCCNRAQWEIRELAKRMLEEVRAVAPAIFDDAGAPCKRGPCPEGDLSCKFQGNEAVPPMKPIREEAPKKTRGRPRGRPKNKGRKGTKGTGKKGSSRKRAK